MQKELVSGKPATTTGMLLSLKKKKSIRGHYWPDKIDLYLARLKLNAVLQLE
jgi:hypothetical protein